MTNLLIINIEDFGGEKPTDDYDDDEDPEWLDFQPVEKKFDFSKQVPLTKMFGSGEEVKLESLEGETLESEQAQQEMIPGQPISIEELEKQTFNKLDQEKPKEEVFGQSQPQQRPPFGQGPPPQTFGEPPQNFQQFPGGNQQMPPQQQPPPMDQFGGNMGFPGFPGQDTFGGFGNPMDNPMGMQPGFGDSMGFGNDLFGGNFGRDAEFEKIFGNTSQPNEMGGFFPPGADPSGKPPGQNMGGMFGFNMGGDQFMAQTEEDDDEEDDWLMDEQFEDTEKHLGFIDQHGDTPSKGAPFDEAQQEHLKQVKAEEAIDRTYKYVKTEKKRRPKPRRVHKFEPKLAKKKRFEKLFEKEGQEEEGQNRKGLHQDLTLYLVKKYWDMKEDPSKLEMLNLVQNPFSYHIVHKRNAPPQFFINKNGPSHSVELYNWFNQGLIPKTFLIGHDQNSFMYNSKPCFLFEKFFNDHYNELFDTEKVPEELLSKPIENTVEESKLQEDEKASQPAATPEENKKDAPPMLQDEGVTLIDASQLESQLYAASQAQQQNSMFGSMMNQPPGAQPMDPAIVSFQSAGHPPGGNQNNDGVTQDLLSKLNQGKRRY